MSPGVMGGSGVLAAESQLFGMLLVRLFRIVSHLGAENEVPDLLYLLAWQISFSSCPVSILLVSLWKRSRIWWKPIFFRRLNSVGARGGGKRRLCQRGSALASSLEEGSVGCSMFREWKVRIASLMKFRVGGRGRSRSLIGVLVKRMPLPKERSGWGTSQWSRAVFQSPSEESRYLNTHMACRLLS